jgi:hypothetical protein
VARFGVLDRSAKYRALEALEEAGLIAVKRARGRSALVTILELGQGESRAAAC